MNLPQRLPLSPSSCPLAGRATAEAGFLLEDSRNPIWDSPPLLHSCKYWLPAQHSAIGLEAGGTQTHLPEDLLAEGTKPNPHLTCRREPQTRGGDWNESPRRHKAVPSTPETLGCTASWLQPHEAVPSRGPGSQRLSGKAVAPEVQDPATVCSRPGFPHQTQTESSQLWLLTYHVPWLNTGFPAAWVQILEGLKY
jgi:hypothetical protein